jgi:hypothetical protein
MLLTRVASLATRVCRRRGSLIRRLVRERPFPLCLGIAVEVPAGKRLRFGLVLPRQGAQFVPRASGVGVGGFRAVAAESFLEEGFEGGKGAGDDAYVAFNAVGIC